MPDQISGFFSPFLRRRRFAAARPFVTTGVVLDFGCGVAELAAEVEPERYVGVDRDEESLATARAAHPKHAILASAEFDLRPAVPEFDVIVALALIEHLEDPGGWLSSMAKRLRPRGRIVLTTPEPRLQWAHDLGARCGLFSREGADEHESLMDRRRLEAVARPAGLRVAKTRRFLLGANQLFVLERAPEPAA